MIRGQLIVVDGIDDRRDSPLSELPPSGEPGSLSPLSSSGQAYRSLIAGRDLVFVPYFTVDTERYNT